MGGFDNQVMFNMLLGGADAEQFTPGMRPKRPRQSVWDMMRYGIPGTSDRDARLAAVKARGNFLEAAPDFFRAAAGAPMDIVRSLADPQFHRAIASVPGEIDWALTDPAFLTAFASAPGVVAENSVNIAADIASGAVDIAGEFFGDGDAMAESPNLAKAIGESHNDVTDKMEKTGTPEPDAEMSVMDRLSAGVGGWEGALSGISDILMRMAHAAANPGTGGTGAAMAGAFAEGVGGLDEVFDEAKLKKYIKSELARDDLPEEERKLLEVYQYGGDDLSKLQVLQQRAGSTGAPTNAALRKNMLNQNIRELNMGGITQYDLMMMENPDYYLHKMREPLIGESKAHHKLWLQWMDEETHPMSGMQGKMSDKDIAEMKRRRGTPFTTWLEGKGLAEPPAPDAGELVDDAISEPESAAPVGTLSEQMEARKESLFPGQPQGSVMDRITGTGGSAAITDYGGGAFDFGGLPDSRPAQSWPTEKRIGRNTLDRQRRLADLDLRTATRQPGNRPFSDWLGGG